MNYSLEVMGRKLRNLREKSKLTEVQLAEFLKVDPEIILKIENGQASLDVSLLEKLADLFCVEISTLIDEDVNLELNIMSFKNFSTKDLEAIAHLNKVYKNIKFMTSIN